MVCRSPKRLQSAYRDRRPAQRQIYPSTSCHWIDSNTITALPSFQASIVRCKIQQLHGKNRPSRLVYCRTDLTSPPHVCDYFSHRATRCRVKLSPCFYFVWKTRFNMWDEPSIYTFFQCQSEHQLCTIFIFPIGLTDSPWS